MKLFLLACFLCVSCFVLAHEGHQETKNPSAENIQENTEVIVQEGKPKTWTQWIGSFHLILLHFPIALINMLVISEFLRIWLNRPVFDFSSKFLLISSAIISPPTALLGLIYSYSASYEGIMGTFLWWHMWVGICTALFAVIVAFIREGVGVGKLYYSSLLLLFLLVNVAGFFGGGMTFGPYHMHPPI